MRARWSMSPCRAPASKSYLISERNSSDTSTLRLQKMMAFFSPSSSALIRSRSAARLSHGLVPDLTSRWVTLAPVRCRRETSTRTGACRNFSVSLVISGGIVAEKNSVCLRQRRDHLADAFDVGDETHVEHAVGFVDDQDLDAVQQELAALAVVEQATRRRDQHIGAALQLPVLLLKGNPADQKRDVELGMVLAVFDEVLFDLRREFARRFQDQRARHASAGTAFLEAREHRQHKGCCLAGTGLGDAQHVLALQAHAELHLPGSASARCSRHR